MCVRGLEVTGSSGIRVLDPPFSLHIPHQGRGPLAVGQHGHHLSQHGQYGKAMWKLNVKPLIPENIKEIKRDYTGWRTMKPSTPESPEDWLETVKRFFIPSGVQKARQRWGKQSKLQKSMQNLLLLQMMGINVFTDLQEVKSQQTSLFASGASKINFRSRVRSVEQDET
eukprot:g26752.t1